MKHRIAAVKLLYGHFNLRMDLYGVLVPVHLLIGCAVIDWRQDAWGFPRWSMPSQSSVGGRPRRPANFTNTPGDP